MKIGSTSIQLPCFVNEHPIRRSDDAGQAPLIEDLPATDTGALWDMLSRFG